MLGEFPDIGEDTLISPAMIRAAEALDLSGHSRAKGQFGWDVARYGSDMTVGYRNRAGMIRLVMELPKSSTMTTAGHINRELKFCARRCQPWSMWSGSALAWWTGCVS